MAKKSLVGKAVSIKQGKAVRVYDIFGAFTVYQKRDTKVTVLGQEGAKNGKTRIYWKRNGYQASALV